MSDLESALAAHLEGKFFWEPTSTPDDCDNVASKEIRAAQKKIAGKAKNLIPGKSYGLVKVNSIKPSSIVLDKERAALSPIIKAVSHAYDVSVDDLLGKSTSQDFAEAKRHLSWAVFRYIPGVSLPEAGRLLGKHHTTVLHGRKTFQSKQNFEKVVEVEQLMGIL